MRPLFRLWASRAYLVRYCGESEKILSNKPCAPERRNHVSLQRRADREITPLIVRCASAESYIGRGSDSSEKRRAASVVKFLGIFLRQWKIETTESSDRGDHVLVRCQLLLILNPSPDHFMHPTGHQVLNKVVKDDRDHDTRIGGEDE